MGPADSRRITRVPRYSGAGRRRRGVSRKGLSPAAAAFSTAFRYPPAAALRPVLQPRPRLDADGLGSCAVARRYWRNHSCFLFLRVLRCFSSPRSPRALGAVWGSLPTGFPIRTPPGLSAFAARRRFSQLVTSFFASESHSIAMCLANAIWPVRIFPVICDGVKL